MLDCGVDEPGRPPVREQLGRYVPHIRRVCRDSCTVRHTRDTAMESVREFDFTHITGGTSIQDARHAPSMERDHMYAMQETANRARSSVSTGVPRAIRSGPSTMGCRMCPYNRLTPPGQCVDGCWNPRAW